MKYSPIATIFHHGPLDRGHSTGIFKASIGENASAKFWLSNDDAPVIEEKQLKNKVLKDALIGCYYTEDCNPTLPLVLNLNTSSSSAISGDSSVAVDASKCIDDYFFILKDHQRTMWTRRGSGHEVLNRNTASGFQHSNSWRVPRYSPKYALDSWIDVSKKCPFKISRVAFVAPLIGFFFVQNARWLHQKKKKKKLLSGNSREDATWEYSREYSREYATNSCH
jgi:hypothetical protein